MVKNVFKSHSLLLLLILFLVSSCATQEKRSHYSKRKARKERTSRTTVYTSPKKNSRSTKAAPKAVSNRRMAIVSTAKKYVGVPYVYGGKKPSSGFDCSGFTAHVYSENGVNITGPSHSQAKKGTRKSIKNVKEGDLVFFGSSNKVSHVGIVANTSRGKVEVVHSTSSRGVVVENIIGSNYWEKRFLFGRDVLH